MTSPPFSKSDLCWVIVRVFGAGLILYALGNLITALAGWRIAMDTVAAKGFPLKQAMLLVLAPLILGLYFLRSGNLLFHCLMFVPSGSPGASVGASGLSGEEQQSFERWLEENPDLEKRDLTDQIALFRDAQNAGEA